MLKGMIKRMKQKNYKLSIRKSIILMSMAFMVAAIGFIGLMVFSRWHSSAKKTTQAIAEEVNEHLYSKISSFLQVPEQINELNHKIIAGGILKLENDSDRDKFFAGVLHSYQDKSYSFSYGTVLGDYFGAQCNKNGTIEIIRKDSSTNGESWFYSVNEDFTAGEVIQKNGPYDPRTNLWYQTAAETQKPTFTPIYQNPIMEDLTLSFACPVYNNNGELEGVIGTHILLNNIGTFLKDTVSIYEGSAIILEKESNYLVANSLGDANFRFSEEGTWLRNNISAISDPDLQKAFETYQTEGLNDYFYRGKENLYINVRQVQKNGINWVIITSIPEDYLLSSFSKSIILAIILVIVFLALLFVLYTVVTGKILQPIRQLLLVTDAFSSGDLSKRVTVSRKDEIGKISESFNKVADKMQDLVINLESTVKERTEELYLANFALEENQNRLEMILNSTAEAIFGVDLKGNLTFCNQSCLIILGYESQDELLGKNVHVVIHHSHRDGEIIKTEDCKIFQAYTLGEKANSDSEVFWRKDGSFFEVSYHAYPQVQNGRIIGAVVTFMDITAQKLKEAEIEYLSYHDSLTGLINRRCFEEYRKKIDTKNNLPLSVIFADLNGLKMTNDVFGHSAGDELIKKSASILKQACRHDDIIARIGGDEFIVLLPKTERKFAERIIERINAGFEDARIEAIKCSISLGLDTKVDMNQKLDQIIANAENAMYRDKTVNRVATNNRILDTIIETLHARNPKEKRHSQNVASLCTQMGIALNYSETDIKILSRVGYLHDIGKIVLNQKIVENQDLTKEEKEQVRLHPVVGYRILNLFDDTLDLADYVYNHHERWDGSGYPKGLKGEEIPLISRIITIADAFERIYFKLDDPPKERKAKAIETFEKDVGTYFDPLLSSIFIQMVKEFDDFVYE